MPKAAKDEGLTYVLSRTRDGFGNLLRNLRWAGQGAGGAVAGAATGLAEDTIKIVGSFRQGLLRISPSLSPAARSDISANLIHLPDTATLAWLRIHYNSLSLPPITIMISNAWTIALKKVPSIG